MDGWTDGPSYRDARTYLKRNEAIYTTASVACDWAGAVMQKMLPNN